MAASPYMKDLCKILSGFISALGHHNMFLIIFDRRSDEKKYYNMRVKPSHPEKNEVYFF